MSDSLYGRRLHFPDGWLILCASHQAPLWDNARRHGAPPIVVSLTSAGGRVEVSVCDQGRGVPDAERERVFEPFYRFPGASETTGAGLGLALVRQIARRHGGDARCVARASGTCFVVDLVTGPSASSPRR